MKSIIDRQKLYFLGAFALLSVLVLVVHLGWIWPGKACESGGSWWDWRTRTCARPVLISDITGRVIADPKARAQAKAALTKSRQETANPKP